MEKIYGMHKLVELQLFWSGTPTFSSGTPTFCQMGVLNSCFQNPSESSDKYFRWWFLGVGIASENCIVIYRHFWVRIKIWITIFVGGFFIQSRLYSTSRAIERHTSIDRSQTQHEHLQLLMIHRNLILQIRYLTRNH